MIRKGLVLVVLSLLSLSTQVTADIGTVSCTNTTSTQFVPSWGSVDIGESGGVRYAYQRVYWESVTRLWWLWTTPESTFEPDLTFYNYDSQFGPAYGNAPAGYWDSNLPAPYVDTQFPYGWNEKEVTIGSAAAYYIYPGVYYYTYTNMSNGGGTKSIFKLYSQRGRRVPADCYSTWCSYGCDAVSNIPIVTFQQHVWAPGGLSYVYP